MPSPDDTSLSYLLERLPVRWSPLLGAFAAELVEQMGAADGRAFFRLLGQRIAREAALVPAEDSLDGWLAAANAWLGQHGWGRVSAEEDAHRLSVAVAPTALVPAFGAQARTAAALYEGLLGHWFEQAGARGLAFELVDGPAPGDGHLLFALAAPTGAAGAA